MATNDFSKEQRVAFEQLLEGFDDSQVLSKAAVMYQTDQTMMARTGDVIWRPQPYIMTSYDGLDQSENFNTRTQLSVPSTLGYYKSVPFVMDDLELRDALQEGRLTDSARQKLASDINIACMDTLSDLGSVVVTRTVAASGYDDVSTADASLTEVGVDEMDRYFAYSPRDYVSASSNLAGRQTVSGIVQTAYEKSIVSQISGFDVLKMNYAKRVLAAAGGTGLTISTLDAAGNYWVPVATQTYSGARTNVDNRFQTVTISSTTSVAAGDSFTIANVYAVHHITKQNTGRLKTFRVVSVDSSTTMTITPPIISNQVSSSSGEQYQNCVVTTKASNASIVFLNTVAGYANPFWQKQALQLLPGRIAVPSDAGIAVMRGTTDNGLEVVMMKWGDIKTGKVLMRVDTLFGTVCTNPEMAGIELFSQSA